ncbi:MAG: ATP-dependent Clp protease proteolytic subunit [Burkholderiales bacterium]|nr:ATP-dependent Clp protease proteolytic subunit [Burkholderiales bacterium]
MINRLLLVFCVLIGPILLGSGVASGDVLRPTPPMVCPNDQESPCDLIRGTISADDYRQVKAIADRMVTSKAMKRSLFYLDSRGGDVEAAIAIGRELRRLSAEVIVNGDCFSACVFILAGGTRRTIGRGDRVGIHRPYPVSTDRRDYATAQREHEQLRKQARAYLDSMNLPTALFDAMLRVPPQEIKILSNDELARYGLNQDDPIRAELEDAEDARTYGITKNELYRRRAIAKAKCTPLPSVVARSICYEEEMKSGAP